MYKALIALKVETVLFSLHTHMLQNVSMRLLILLKAAVSAGCPEGAIGVIQRVSIEATNELMKHKDTNLILAAGWECKLRIHQEHLPLGVGPGNGQPLSKKLQISLKAVQIKFRNSKTLIMVLSVLLNSQSL